MDNATGAGSERPARRSRRARGAALPPSAPPRPSRGLDERLDAALEATFPASDPVAISGDSPVEADRRPDRQERPERHS
ncbi:MAG TPA: hypothetical protein VHZ26_09020 [Caulobacteraceae bacterium]|nr:hypothetical protein [Caulobacteraceae bacterium]